MRNRELHKMWLVLLLLIVFLPGCSGGGSGGVAGGGAGPTPHVTNPTVLSTNPVLGATGVPDSQVITVLFSKPMAQATINSSSLTVTGPNGAVAGVVTYAGSTGTFTPSSPLAGETLYTINVTAAATDLKGNTLVAYSGGFTTADDTIPTVSSTNPMNKATGTPLFQNITATFSEAMNGSTLDQSTFTVSAPGPVAVDGMVSYDSINNIATFIPGANLTAGTVYTATITTGAQEPDGTPLGSAYSWTFTTGSSLDTSAPSVISTIPNTGAINVPVNQGISATFNEAMVASSIVFTVTAPGPITIPGTVTYAGSTATFTPSGRLPNATTLTATIAAGAQDLAGNGLVSDYSWTFATDVEPDSTPPTVTSTNPVDGATNVALDQDINATFSEAMDPFTITTGNFLVTVSGGAAVEGTVVYDVASEIATFVPSSNLASNTTYTATITSGVTDLTGNRLATPFVWSFHTGETASINQAPIDLGSATNFVIIAGAGITNTGPTTLNGDVALSPPGAVTGAPTVNGTTYTSPNAIADQAQMDATTAYTDLSTRPNPIIIASGELGGLVLGPGLYQSGISSFGITLLDVTLDAQGDPNAIFIFQMPSSTLTVGNGRSVILVGGAKASNVFWQVGSSATLGTTSSVQGTILASAAITLETGATLNGRALAESAAVTLDTNTATLPSP